MHSLPYYSEVIERRDFYDANPLEGDLDMYVEMNKLLEASSKQKLSIPMRTDHGNKILDDLNKNTNSGYSAIGRLRELAE